MNTIRDRVRQLRVEKGWSQQSLSNDLEVMAIHAWSWLHTPDPRHSLIPRISDTQQLAIDVEYQFMATIIWMERIFHDRSFV